MDNKINTIISLIVRLSSIGVVHSQINGIPEKLDGLLVLREYDKGRLELSTPIKKH